VTAPFTDDEVTRWMESPAAHAAALGAVAALREGRLDPLRDVMASGIPAREGAFAVSVQGLAPRLAELPGRVGLPAELSAHLDGEAIRCAARGERISGVLSRLLAAFRRVGLRAVPLKGSALVLRGEVPAGLRPMGDVDLLLASPRDVPRAADVVRRELGYRSLLDTPRHLVMAEGSERVPFPGGEHPGNPLRIELHRSFRLPVLGVALDATRELLAEAEEGPAGPLLSRGAILLHLLFHAAEDFAARGLRGVQAADFLVLARNWGPLVLPPLPRPAAGPVLFAVDAVERLFPGSFQQESVEALATVVPPGLRAFAGRQSVLRHSRPVQGWTRTSLSLAGGAGPRLRFVLRTLFPTLGEVKANVAPEAEGLSLAAAWGKVLARRVARGLAGFSSRG
jgi:hypothetical protein